MSNDIGPAYIKRDIYEKNHEFFDGLIEGKDYVIIDEENNTTSKLPTKNKSRTRTQLKRQRSFKNPKIPSPKIPSPRTPSPKTSLPPPPNIIIKNMTPKLYTQYNSRRKNVTEKVQFNKPKLLSQNSPIKTLPKEIFIGQQNSSQSITPVSPPLFPPIPPQKLPKPTQKPLPPPKPPKHTKKPLPPQKPYRATKKTNTEQDNPQVKPVKETLKSHIKIVNTVRNATLRIKNKIKDGVENIIRIVKQIEEKRKETNELNKQKAAAAAAVAALEKEYREKEAADAILEKEYREKEAADALKRENREKENAAKKRNISSGKCKADILKDFESIKKTKNKTENEKKLYRNLSLMYHPDKNTNDPINAEKCFKYLNCLHDNFINKTKDICE